MPNNLYLQIRNYTVIVITCVMCAACARQNPFRKISVDYVESLSKEESFRDKYIVVPVNEKEEAIIINEAFKQIIYEQYYLKDYPDYYDFLYALYKDGSVKDMKTYLNGYPYTDDYNLIMKEYEKYGFDFIVKKYLKEVNTDRYGFKGDAENAIIRILFINGYHISFDDYSGRYYFSLNSPL